jgi:hypothetical protein
MSEPMSPPPPSPPPPGAPPPPVTNAAQQVQGPAIGLIVTAAVGILFSLFGLLANLLGFRMASMEDFGGGYGSQYWSMWSGGMGIGLAIVALAVWAFVGWAAMKMKALEQWTMAIVASVVAMIPCSCACILGLPIGIWSLVVLLKPEVKAAFRS